MTNFSVDINNDNVRIQIGQCGPTVMKELTAAGEPLIAKETWMTGEPWRLIEPKNRGEPPAAKEPSPAGGRIPCKVSRCGS
jgi:hypothetical protein